MGGPYSISLNILMHMQLRRCANDTHTSSIHSDKDLLFLGPRVPSKRLSVSEALFRERMIVDSEIINVHAAVVYTSTSLIQNLM